MVALIAAGARTTAAGGGSAARPARRRNPGGGNNPGGPAGQRVRAGPAAPVGQAAPAAQTPEEEEKDVTLCLGSAKEAGNCLLAARAPNTVSEKITERARDKVRQAQRNLYNSSARPGTPRVRRLVAKRTRARSRSSSRAGGSPTTSSSSRSSQVRKVVDPRYKDIRRASTARAEALQGPKTNAPVPLKPNTSSGGPVKPCPASKFLKGLGKVGKGLGIAGTALSLYDNIKNDGVAKGITKTAGGVAGAWGAGAAVTAGCVAVGVATAGVGGLVCAGVALAASLLRRQARQRDRGLGLRSGRGRRELRQRKGLPSRSPAATETAVDRVKDVGDKAVDGGKKVLGALNPFG